MPNVLSPNQRVLTTLSEMRQMDRERDLDIATPAKDDDHPMIKEIRRKLVEMVHEFVELDLI